MLFAKCFQILPPPGTWQDCTFEVGWDHDTNSGQYIKQKWCQFQSLCQAEAINCQSKTLRKLNSFYHGGKQWLLYPSGFQDEDVVGAKNKTLLLNHLESERLPWPAQPILTDLAMRRLFGILK